MSTTATVRVSVVCEPWEVPTLTEATGEHAVEIPRALFDRYQETKREFDDAFARLGIALADAKDR